MDKFNGVFLRVCLAAIPIIGIGWILAITDYFGVALTFQQVIAVVLGFACACAFLTHPYFEKPGLLEIGMSLIAFFSWFWMAYNFEDWIVTAHERTPDKWIPGALALILMMEGLRKAAGKIIACLVWVLIAYAFFGDYLPGALEAAVFPTTKTITYFYADNNGVPGLVLQVVLNLVLAFIIFGKLMEVSGGTAFLTDLAMGWMGHRRGGPAKVAVVASSAFGTISGSTVGNIMSTGIVTIPLMKKTGFRPEYAGAIEAVASNGGQIAPPVMGATAFIIAEFLEVPYQDVVIAAAMPALLYFLVLFVQVDAVARRFSIRGLPKADLPIVWAVMKVGWVFVLPIAILMYFLFWMGYPPGVAALYSAASLVVLMVVRDRRPPSLEHWKSFLFGSGEILVPLILIAGAAGIILGVMNSTGLAFQLSIILAHLGEAYGVFVMLLLTSLICIVLGMGMPTATVYIVLVSVIGPALIKMGLVPMGAHLFLFYFGLISMLTPPVAIASMVAAEMAGADMWKTGFIGVQLAATAYLLPYLWAFNPALILDGTMIEIVFVVTSCISAGFLLAHSVTVLGNGKTGGWLAAAGMYAACLVVGSSTIWLGAQNPATLAVSAAGLGLVYAITRKIKVLDPATAE
ncbi:MAG: TRAP transporter fused permease subunit [Pseudomonadota bacterium]|nr:TRAP transporter fused permease subunit [Pseudomonadota bacterium]